MSRPIELLAHAERREAAAAWLVRLEAPEAAEADWIAFEQWLADPENKRALDEIDRALAVVEDHRDAFDHRQRPPVTHHLRSAVFVALASAAAVLLFMQLRPVPSQTFSYEAPASGARAVALPDGTSVTLNRGAFVEVRWSPTERRVILGRGEAAFRVTHNESAPFAVVAGAASISDLGTEFNVLRARDALTVTVRDGSVALSGAGRVLTLTAGDQIRIDNGRVATRRVNADDAFAWRNGRLVYRDALLSEVVADLNRYSATPISIADGQAASLRFSGILVIDSAAAMTTRLEAFLPVRSEHNTSGIVIRSR